ncbi:MAG: hypothetical protein KDJ15_00815 [Alphaproteobacteria bacterium]|nr:hypothetical protein [Alphaproteobacteria bacterium]
MIEDVAAMAGGALNIVGSLRHQAREDLRSRLGSAADRLDLVHRDDLDRALAMIAALERRIAVLEGKKAKGSAS